MTDVRIVNVTNLDGVWADWLLLPNGQLDQTEELANQVKVALLTHGLAAIDDVLPNLDNDDRKGWWGDLDADTIWDGWPIGAKIWLLRRAKITPADAREGATVTYAEQYCRTSLAPLIDKKLCSAIDVVATRVGLSRIDVSVTVYRGPLRAIELRFQNLWSEIGV
jgi:phage gp46-like protein